MKHVWKNKATFLLLVTLEQTFIAEKLNQGKEEINMESYKKKKKRKDRKKLKKKIKKQF